MRDFYWADRRVEKGRISPLLLSENQQRWQNWFWISICVLGGWLTLLASIKLYNTVYRNSVFLSRLLSNQGLFGFFFFQLAATEYKYQFNIKFWSLYITQHAENWQPTNKDGRRAQVRVPFPWSQNTFNCQSFIWTRAVKINVEYKIHNKFSGRFWGTKNSAV